VIIWVIVISIFSSTSDIGNEMSTESNLEFTDTITTNNTWTTNETDLFNFTFVKQPGLLVSVPENGKPIDFFFMCFDEDFYELIARETNNYAESEFLRVGVAERSRISQWKPKDRDEIIAFIFLVIHTGIIKLNRLNDYWKNHHLFNFTCFSNYMSRDRFLLLLRCFHFSQNPTDQSENIPTDRLFKIRPLINYFNTKMNNIYYPSKELSLDESIVLWRGRLIFRQYIQNKCHKYGVKLYMHTEPNSLIIKFAVYTGILDDQGGKGHAANIVLHLVSEKLNNGHSIYMDNFYNSIYLAEQLLQKKIYCTGIKI